MQTLFILKGGTSLNDVIKRIEIEVYSSNSYEVIKAQQGDNLSRKIEFVLYDQGKPYTISSSLLFKVEGHRGDGSSFMKDNCISISDNIITVTLDDDILYDYGTVEAKLVMYDLSNNSVLSTVPFRIHVQKNPCDKSNLEKEKTSIINELILKVEALNIKQNEMSDEKYTTTAVAPSDQKDGDYWTRLL